MIARFFLYAITLLVLFCSCQGEELLTNCQLCISQNSDILPQRLCDNGDGTFTIDDTASVRTKEFPQGTNFESLIRALESGDKFACGAVSQ